MVDYLGKQILLLEKNSRQELIKLERNLLRNISIVSKSRTYSKFQGNWENGSNKRGFE